MAITPGEHADIKITGAHVLQASLDRTIVRGEVLLHGENAMAEAGQRFDHSLSKRHQIGVGGRKIDRRHRSETAYKAAFRRWSVRASSARAVSGASCRIVPHMSHGRLEVVDSLGKR